MAPCLYNYTQKTNLVANDLKQKMSISDYSDDHYSDDHVPDNLFEDRTEQSVPHLSAENAYFLLDLKLPDPKTDIQSEPVQDSSSCSPKKYGFLELLEKIHNKDLKSNNPWLNPEVTANKRHWRKRYKKQVRFSTTEISTATMPHCRRKTNYGNISGGQLHATQCSNAAQETAEVLGEHVWYNRVFILETCVRRPASLAEFYNELQAYDTEEDGGYCKPGAEETGVVFDSVELRKKQLSQESTPTEEPMEVTPPDQEVHPAGPADSDTSSITSSSTVKLADLDTISLTTPPAASAHQEFDPSSSGSMDRDSAIGDDHGFEMYEPPRFQAPSDSDYGSEGVSEDEMSDAEEDSEVHLTTLLEKISGPTAPVHQMWFKAHPEPPASQGPSSQGQSSGEGSVAGSSSGPGYRTPWSDRHIADSCLRGTLNIVSSSVIGELLAPGAPSGAKLGARVGSGAHVPGLDKPSPDDLVRKKQSAVFK